jgi:extracellular elastinolytic metalloproteinase
VIDSHYPRSVRMTCGSHADLDGGDVARSATHTTLHYLAKYDVYVFLWRTDSGWDNTCRQFVLKLSDGSYHRADFRFPDTRHGHH